MEPTSIAGKPLAARCRTFHQCDMVFRTDYDGFYGACHACRSRVGKQVFFVRIIEIIRKDYIHLRIACHALSAAPRRRMRARLQANVTQGDRKDTPSAALLIQSPYDVDARYSQKRETQETCQ